MKSQTLNTGLFLEILLLLISNVIGLSTMNAQDVGIDESISETIVVYYDDIKEPMKVCFVRCDLDSTFIGVEEDPESKPKVFVYSVLITRNSSQKIKIRKIEKREPNGKRRNITNVFLKYYSIKLCSEVEFIEQFDPPPKRLHLIIELRPDSGILKNVRFN